MADIRIHDITGEVTIARFTRAEAKALKPISGTPPFRATRELIRRVGSDCTVEIDGNAYWAIDPADYAGVAGANGRYAATPPPACMPATAPASLVRDLSFRTALSELPQPIHVPAVLFHPLRFRPVTFPLGRTRLTTSPAPMGSPADMMIGMTLFALSAPNVAGVPLATMTSTGSSTNSAANFGNRSAAPSANRYSTPKSLPS